MPLLVLLLVPLSSLLFFFPHPFLSFFPPPGLRLMPLPVLLSHLFFCLRGLLRHVLYSFAHLGLRLLLIQRLLLSFLTILLHRLNQSHYDLLHL